MQCEGIQSSQTLLCILPFYSFAILLGYFLCSVQGQYSGKYINCLITRFGE